MNVSRVTPLLLAAACLAPTAIFAQSDGWRRVNSLQVEGIAALPGNVHRPFRATRFNDLFAFETTLGISGALDLLPRHEVANTQGAFTWLDASPDWTLQLPESSLPELARVFQPIRASMQELRSGPFALARQFGQEVRDMGQGTLCGRPCRMLTVTNAGAGIRTSQRLWVDLETGLLLRRDEDSAGSLLPSYALTRFTPEPSCLPAAFQLPTDAKTIRGLVNPGILLHTKDTPNADAELTKVRKTSRFNQGNWITAMPAPAGFTYAQTLLQEYIAPDADTGQDFAKIDLSKWNFLANADMSEATTLYSDLNVHIRRNDNNIYYVPSQNWGENAGQVQIRAVISQRVQQLVESMTGADVDASMARAASADRAAEAAAPGSQERAKAEAEADAARNEAAQGQWQTGENLSSAAFANLNFIASNDTIQLFNMDGSSVNPLPANVKACVETDFLDRASGDTVSLFQLHNRDWKPLLHGIKTTSGASLQSGRYKAVSVFEAASPFALHGIVWKEGGCDFVLVSTRLDVKALLALAETLPSPAPELYYRGGLNNF